jgi:hypothetical protein
LFQHSTNVLSYVTLVVFHLHLFVSLFLLFTLRVLALGYVVIH